MRLVLCLGIFVAVCLVCAPVFAQSESVKLRLSAWDTGSGLNLTVSEGSIIGTEVSKGLLGLRDDHFVPSIELIFYKSGFKLTLGYWEALSTGSTKLSKEIKFGGETYTASDTIESKLRIISYDLRVQVNVVPISTAEIGLVGGLRLFQCYTQIVDTTTPLAASDEAYAGSPYFGAAAEFVIGDLVALGASVVTFSYGRSEFKLSSYLDANVYTELRYGPLAARLGYNNIKLNFKKTGTDAVDVEYYIKGPYFGVYLALPF
jgi:hypothetical protein